MCKSVLPQEIIGDLCKFLEANDICRMDRAESPTSTPLGRYVVGAGENTYYEFNRVEMAPPAGVFALNYSRAMHSEYQPHKFALAWTTNRSPESIGGHFYISSHGIQIKSAPNTLVVWQPSAFVQTGIAIVTSSRLPNAWKKYKETHSGITQLEADLQGEEVDDISDI
ncbi:hypothetical protein EDD22DRAFT_844466 [Suillus occidentalis]|nr:hypothetical protein EDD22DRAFT_844466 [Suillus occidentalis]